MIFHRSKSCFESDTLQKKSDFYPLHLQLIADRVAVWIIIPAGSS